ncbi:MAG: hypothetical protein U0Z44_15235 [Kouleothrix sp.]
MTLRFTFPDVARTNYRAGLAGLAEHTGWSVRVWPQPHQESLMQAARQPCRLAWWRSARRHYKAPAARWC